jgi:ribosomal-protein-alanine N-acetyltransferase
MYHNWASDIDTLRYLPWGPHSDVNVTHRRILSWVENYNQPNVYNWAIYLKANRQVIGSISVEMSNDKEKSCEVGYCIGRSFWGRELVPEAFRAIMHYLFFEVGYRMIFAKYDVLNTASGRVMQKVGMYYEGTIKDAGRRRDGSIYDVVIYVKRKNDFKEEL